MPATCHSFASRYALIASAARKDRLRPVLLANFSNRFLTAASIRTVKVVEDMSWVPCLIVYKYHYWPPTQADRRAARTGQWLRFPCLAAPERAGQPSMAPSPRRTRPRVAALP